MQSLGRYAKRLQIMFAIAKLLAMLTIIITGFYFLVFRGWTTNFTDLMEGSNYDPGELTLAVYGGLWAYGGYNVLNFGIEEVKNPRKTMSLAMLGGMALVIFLYLTINVAYFVVLSKEEMLESETSAIAQQFASKVLGGYAYAYPLIIGIVLGGSANSGIFSSSRIMFAAARRGQMPSCLGLVSIDSGSPRVAIIIFLVLTIAMSFIGNIEQLINYVISLSWLQGIFSVAALLWIRYKKIPVHKQAIKFNIVIPILHMLVSIALVVIPVYQQPIESAIGLGILISGFTLYYMLIKSSLTPRFLRQINESSMVACQKLFLSVPDLKATEASEVRQRKKNTVQDSQSKRTEAQNQKY